MLKPEECPAGSNCPVHHRVDSTINEPGYFSAISYVGEYAVFTGNNPAGGLSGIISAALAGRPCPDMFVTSVFKVGANGSLYDTYNEATKATSDPHFTQTHDDLDNVENAHLMVVESVKNDLLDLSKPASA